MAQEQIVTNIVAKSDFSNLLADLQKVTGSLTRLQQEFAGANRALSGQIAATNAMFSETMRKTGQFSTHFVSLTSDVEKFGKNLDGGRLKLRDYFRVYQDHVRTHGGLIRDLAKQQVQLQNAVLQPLGKNAQGLMQYNVHIPRGLDLTKNKTSLLKQELQIMNKVIQDGGVQLINWGKNTQWAGRQLTVGLTLPLVAFGKAAADAFRVADQELTRLTKVYGDIAGTSSQELSRVRNEVAATSKQLSASMGVNFAETISLAADIAATGKTGNELLGSLTETTRLAVLGEVDRQEAMKATLAIQSAFRQNTDQLSESINFLNAVENQTSTTLNDLVEAIPKAGPVIKGLGGDVQDLALYLTAMREGGINASEGANALKSALASLINPTDVAVKKFQGFGIDLLNIVNSNAGNVTQTLFALQAALDRLDPLSKQQAIEQLFGKFQFSRLNALFENLGRQGSQTLQVLDLMKASAGELEAVAGRELAAVTESASGRYRRAIESLKADLAGVGDQFLDIGTKLINILSKVIEFGQKLPDPIKKILAFGGAFTAIAGPVIMLTGVLANFFGYIVKGLGHFKALFKGAEGFKLLTPEIMAAQHASSMLGDEFYSDAQAADILRLAIDKLNADLILLQKNASTATSAASGLGKAMTTAAGVPVAVMGGPTLLRQSDPNHPLIGGLGRASAHLNPRDPNNPATLFGLTFQPEPLNRVIGRTPQVLMTERLPNIEGLTSVGGRSTGVVAGEHARLMALMATLGLQSRQEVEQLKKTIKFGGQVSSEFIATFDDILPITTTLSKNAAAQSAAIVAELNAGKITVEQAKARIIALNAQLELMMGEAIVGYGASRGRTIDLTKTPLIDQPIVDATGKPNVRGMFRQGIFRDVMTAVGRATRTKTYGGPYSIETTSPIVPPGYTVNPSGLIVPIVQRNKGGGIFYNNGDQVPGPNVNADVVPAMLTPGEFVIRRDVAQQDPEGMRLLNQGQAVVVPLINRNNGGAIPRIQNFSVGGGVLNILKNLSKSKMKKLIPGFSGTKRFYNAKGTAGVYIGDIRDPKIIAKYGTAEQKKAGVITRQSINSSIIEGKIPGPLFAAAIKASGASMIGSADNFLMGLLQNGIITKAQFSKISKKIEKEYFRYLSNSKGVGDINNQYWRIANSIISKELGRASNAGYLWRGFSSSLGAHTGSHTATTGRSGGSTTALALKIPDKNGNIINFGTLEGTKDYLFAHTKAPDPLMSRAKSVTKRNRGGMIPGIQYRNRGGAILRLLAMLGIPMAGQTVGSRVGGTAGSAISTASMIAPMMMMPGMMPGARGATALTKLGIAQNEPGQRIGQSIFAQGNMLGKYNDQVSAMATSNGKLASTFGRLLAGITKFNLALGAGSALVFAGIKIWQNYNKTQEASAAQFGLTAEQAQKAGLKYTDYTSRLKDAIQAQKLINQQNKIAFESMSSAGTPFNLTITEYKKLRKEVKETMQTQIDMFNQLKNIDEISRVATQLKVQFVAAGMSVEDANKKIYTLLQLSNKSAMSISAMASKPFREITNAQKAATAAIEGFNYATQFENTKDQAFALNTALGAIDNSITDLYKKAEDSAKKKQKDFDATKALREAEKKTLDEINSKVQNQATISEQLYNQLLKQDPVLGKMINRQDTMVSLWQKMKIAAMGYSGVLSVLNAKQAARFYELTVGLSEAIEKQNKSQGGLLEQQYKRLGELTDRYKSLSLASKGQSVRQQIDTKKQIELIDEEIKKINERAEARKKELQDAQSAEDYSIQLQKLDFELQQALATGDMQAAAQAQLNIREVVSNRQTDLAIDEVERQREAKVAPLQERREAISKNQQELADKAALASENLNKVAKELEDQERKINRVNSALLNYRLMILRGETDQNKLNDAASGAITALKNAGVAVKNFQDSVTIEGPFGTKIKQPLTPKEILDGIIEKSDGIMNIETILAQKDIIIRSNGDIIVDGKKLNIGGTGSKENPYDAGKASDIKLTVTTGKTSQSVPISDINLRNPSREILEQIAKTGKGKGYAPGDYFTLTDSKGNEYRFKLNKEGKAEKAALGKYISGYSKGSTGGSIEGPGTGTSDSILARLSNGEFVTKASSVSDIGVGNMHLVNSMGAEGLIRAAKNIIEGKAGGGYLKGYPMGGLIPYFKDGGAPHEMGMRNQLSARNKNWFENYVANLTKTSEQLPSWARDPLGAHQILRKIAGQRKEGDNPALAAALLPLNFFGSGLGSQVSNAASFGRVFLRQAYAGLLNKLPGKFGLSTKFHGGPSGIPSGGFLKQDLRGWNFPGTYLTDDPISAAQYGAIATKNSGRTGNVGSIYKFGVKPGQKVSVLNLSKKATPELKNSLIDLINNTSDITPESKSFVINAIKNSKTIDEAVIAARSVKFDTNDLFKFSEISQPFTSKVLELSGITSESVDLVKNFRSRDALDRLAELRRQVKDLPGLGGYNSDDDIGQWIITNMSKFVSKEIPTDTSNLIGATKKLQLAVNSEGILNSETVGPRIAQQSLENWKTYIKQVVKNRMNPGSVPAEELKVWTDYLLPQLIKYNPTDRNFKIFELLTGSKHPYDIQKSFDTSIATGGYINNNKVYRIPSFDIGTKLLYSDTIAQLHKGEAVLPEAINPWNPNATNPIGGNTYYIQPTINAAPGMDENALANLAAQKVHDILKKADSKSGLSRSR